MNRPTHRSHFWGAYRLRWVAVPAALAVLAISAPAVSEESAIPVSATQTPAPEKSDEPSAAASAAPEKSDDAKASPKASTDEKSTDQEPASQETDASEKSDEGEKSASRESSAERAVAAAAEDEGTLNVTLTQKTGTGPFDADDAPGHDSSADNDVVRTNDTVTYNVGVRFEGADQTKPTITFTLPKGEELVSLPPFCKAGSSVTPSSLPDPVVPVTLTSWQTLPTQTVTCVVEDQTQGTSLDYAFLSKVRPEVPDGTSLGPVSVSATSDQVTTPATSGTVEHSVSAVGQFDVSKRGSSTNENSGPLWAGNTVACSFDSAQACRLVQYPLTISAPSGGKGITPLASPITLTDDITPTAYYGAAAWADAVAAAGSEAAAVAKYAPRLRGCGAGGGGVGDLYRSLPNTSGGGDTGVRDSGTVDCTQAGGAGNPVSITITGADTTAYTVPTESRDGTALPADTGYVVSTMIMLEVPVDAILEIGTTGADGSSWTLPTNNTFTDVAMSDISGHPNTGEVEDNNNRKTVLQVRIGEGFDKWFSGIWGTPGNTSPSTFSPGFGAWQGPPGSSVKRDGNTVVVPGQVVQSNLFFAATGGVPNSGTQYARSYFGCDVWDESKLALTKVNSPSSGDRNNRPSNGAAAWISYFNPNDAVNAPISDIPGLTIEYSKGPAGSGADSDCSTGTWASTPEGVPGASVNADGEYSGVNRVRISFSSEYKYSADYFYVNLAMGMTVKETVPPGDIVPNWASNKNVNGTKTTAQILADDSARYRLSSYNPTDHTSSAGDRLLVGGVTARLKKYVKNPTTGDFSSSAVPQYTSGSNVDYRLNPTITADVSAGTKAPVVVEDCLPKYQQFVSSKREGSGTAIVPVLVQQGSPAGAELQCAAGETYVKWDLGENTVNETIDPIVYTVEILETVRNANYENTALVSSSKDPSPKESREATAQIQVITPTGIKISKSTPQNVVEVNPDGVATPRTLKWTVNFANIDAPANVENVDVIDVLPADGISGSDFTGTTAFTSATVAAGTGITILYTKGASSSLAVDPDAPSNLAAGATTWCDSATGGAVVSGSGSAADCPASPSEVTGLRFLRAGSFTPDDDLSVDVVMTPSKNAGGDVYRNITAGRVDGVSQGVGPAARKISIIESSIGDFVWEDLNKNGIQDDGEPGVKDFPVTLTGVDLDGNPVTLSTTTDADGKYEFAHLASGTYKVTFDPNGLTSNSTFTTKNVGSDNAVDSDADTTTGETGTFTLSPDSANPTVDAGLVIDRNVQITVDKRLVSQTEPDADNTSKVTYEVVVANAGTAEGVYDVSDELQFGGDVTVDSVEAANTAPGDIEVDPEFDGVEHTSLATGQTIAGGQTDVYRVVVDATVGTKISAEQRDCSLTETETGTGYLNEAQLTVNDVTTTDTACGTPDEPVVEGTTVDKPDDDTSAKGDGILPNTGGPVAWLLALGAVSLATGLVMVRRSERRENRA